MNWSLKSLPLTEPGMLSWTSPFNQSAGATMYVELAIDSGLPLYQPALIDCRP